MEKYRKYGETPFKVAVIHGGPGAPGSMFTVAKKLSNYCGVIEPLQSAKSIARQIKELKHVLNNDTDLPVTLIGHSWGAWLSYIFAAQYPEFIAKLILVGSGPFEHKYVAKMKNIRSNRLDSEDKKRIDKLQKCLFDHNYNNKEKILKEFGKIMSKVDSYNPIPFKNEIIEFQPQVFNNIMEEASKLREKGELLGIGRDIDCPVVAIHGDYDPHPHEGVRKPLTKLIDNFNFILLENCGHTPWEEKHIKNHFYRLLRSEIKK